ncbi:MAG TPA: SDR family NAD(P)-dependent oxidoreductase [Mycobacteriales bacterium]|nr:SDR family NAD(P)-dependent oxidoreductase [Mycobacteriales bacterium]
MAATAIDPALLKGTRVLVTGASGFIGSHLTRRLVEDGAVVHALTSTVSSIYPQRILDIRDQITLHEGSLDDRSAMDALADAARPEYVFHLGAYTHVGKSWQRVDECIQVNVQGTVNLLQALAPLGYKKFVYTGTSEIYGDVDVPFREDGPVNPISPYSVSKYAGEKYCRMFFQGKQWPIVMVRPFNAYGPAQSPDRVIPEIIVRALRKQRLAMTQGKQTREFNYVTDIADGFVRAALFGEPGRLYNIGGGQEVERSMRDLATTILRLMGDPIEPEFGALPERPTEIWRMYAASERARTELGWAPQLTFEQGLQNTIDWYTEELSRQDSSFAITS